MLTRRSFAAAPFARPQPNLVFILADDHAGYVLGRDGNDKAETPNLDRLASEGTRFAANYCNSPVCTPSRQSILTGQLPHAAGVTLLQTKLASDRPTLAKQLKIAGYTTAVFGKMHWNQPGTAGLHGFDHVLTEAELNRAWVQAGGVAAPAGIATKPLPWRPFQTPASQWLNAANLPYPRADAGMRSAFLLERVAAYLAQAPSKPLALWVSFQEPHSPFDFPVGDARFSGGDFVAPRVGPEDAWQVPNIFRELADPDKQGIIAAYYNSVRYLDRNVGRLLDSLGRHGLEENTLLVYMSDHGYSLGQHGRFEKHCGYDPALRVPLMMRWPGRIRQGTVSDFTESVDVPHTILDLLGAPPLPVRHGRSLRPYLEGRRVSSPRTAVFSEYLENEEVYLRTRSHKLIYGSGKRKRTDGYETADPTPGPYTRLFDLKADPGEFTDVSGKNAKLVAKLKLQVLGRFHQTHPDAAAEPASSEIDRRLDFFLRPRDQ